MEQDSIQPTTDEGTIGLEAGIVEGRIAVIEDGEATRYFLLRALRGQGYSVKGIEDGTSALPLLRAFRPDIILLDVHLPGLSGFDICKLIRQDPLLRAVTVILLTACASAEDRMAGWSAGADDYLVKPCEVPEVLARIAAHLRHREMPHQQWQHPITLLPAPARLEEELQSRIRRGESFAVCYADITHFKSYNNRYGYQAGDALLAMMADLLREIVNDLNGHTNALGTPATSLAGHLGSDDFVLITPPDQVLDASAMIAQRFSTLAPSLYRVVDRDRGWVPGVDPRGEMQNYPLVTLTVATIIKHPGEFVTVPDGAIAHIATGIWQQLRGIAQASRRVS